MTISMIDRVARRIRHDYGKQADPHTRAHVEAYPWDTLPDRRKEKWRVMAAAAIAEVKESDA